MMLCVPLVFGAAVRRMMGGGGMLIKDVNAFEGAWSVTDVVFDKTGTVTLGKPTVIEEVIIGETVKIRRMAAELVREEVHPVSKGVAAFLSSQLNQDDEYDTALDKKESIPGSGIKAESNGQIVRAGNLAFCNPDRRQLPSSVQALVSSMQTSTFFFVSIDGDIVAAYALADTLKPEVKAVVQELRNVFGVRVSIFSGDNDGATWAVGKELGLAREDVRGGCSPQMKRDVVRSMAWQGDCEQEEQVDQPSKTEKRWWQIGGGKKKAFVIFVGDGSNDSGALSQADLGVSFQSSGTQMATSCADVLILNSSSLEGISTLIRGSRNTIWRMRLCFAWAILYNLLAFILSSGMLVVWRLEPRWAGVGELVSLAPVFVIALL